MKVAAIPANEKERQEALNNYNILDTLPEVDFNDFTELAAFICKTPIALISLVDNSRQWFKAKVGLDANETPRDLAFCSHAILGDEVFIVSDSLKDERFKDNPLAVGAPHVRFYAGAPLKTPSGHNIGTLCVIDHSPRELSSEQSKALKALARQIVNQLELRAKAEMVLLSQQLLKTSPIAIFCKDYQSGVGKIVEWNSEAEKLFGLKREDCIGKDDYCFFPKEQADFFKTKDLEALKAGQRLCIDQEPIDTPHGRIICRTWKAPVNDVSGTPRYLLGISLDITKQIELEKQLHEAKKEAEQSSITKSAFLANMSHEIRTPMNGIIGMANLLLGSTSDPVQIEQISILQNCGNALLDIINDVLDFSKLEAGKVELENIPVNIHETLSEVVQLLDVRAKEKGVGLSCKYLSGGPAWINGDGTRIRQILTNLISNAIKFTEKGAVHIICEAVKSGSKKWRIQFSVKDSGIGIPENLQDKLFLSFSQVDASTNRRFGGSGLGLAICKGLTEKMGGRIWVESTFGKGSTFSFSIEAEETIAVTTERSVNPFAKLDLDMGKKHPLRILVAEDNHTNQIVIRGLLNKLGYLIDIASNGREAIECLERQQYDVILMDCHMPEVDGFEATKRITKMYPKPGRPQIVALTASTMKEDIDLCFSSGMVAFVAKPINLETLVKVLGECTTIKVSKFLQPEALSQKSSELLASFDQDAFSRQFEGMENVMRDVLNVFVDSLPKMSSAIKVAIVNKNPKALCVAAHSLRGAVSNFYAEPARLLAFQLEELGRANSVEGAEQIFSELEVELKQFLKVLTEYLAIKKAV